MIEEFTELQYSNDRKGPFKLYIFDKDGYHSGGKWFRPGEPKYPDEEITLEQAKLSADYAKNHGKEVRICDGGDFLVYHSVGGKVIYPKPPADFWGELIK
jgi:hypothetical protein